MKPQAEPQKMRAIVCGTVFGQVYLNAFRAVEMPFELCGILARGSERSRACAREFDVPLFTELAEIPGDVEIACVVIRSGLLGGKGSQLAQDLLQRGIHVLQEHPLHYDELAACLRQARRHGVVYRLNPFYRHVPAVKRFMVAARELVKWQQPQFVDAACGLQVTYALLDVIGATLDGVRPWALREQPPPSSGLVQTATVAPSFRSLDGIFAGLPLTLRVQNQLDPSDPDNHAHLLHRITLGFETGSLILVDTHGPILWIPRPHFPANVREPDAQPYFRPDAAGDGRQDRYTEGDDRATVIGPQRNPSYREIFGNEWPRAVKDSLLELRHAILTDEDPLLAGQLQLSICQIWQEIAARLGPPDLVRRNSVRPSIVDALAAIERSVTEAGIKE